MEITEEATAPVLIRGGRLTRVILKASSQSPVSTEVQVCLFKDAVETHLKWKKKKVSKWKVIPPIKKKSPIMFFVISLWF